VTRPLLVVGISGATWDVLDPLIAAGRLPTLARLRREGTAGVLRSVRATGDDHYRPQVAWATVATGCVPERHGVVRFFHDGGDLREPPLWELWSRSGGTVGVYGWPGTWPPTPVEGFVVPSHLARDDRTWPPGLAPIKRLDRLLQGAEREPHARASVHAARLLLGVVRRHRVGAHALARIGALAARMPFADQDERRLLRRIAKLELGVEVLTDLRRRFAPDLVTLHTFLPDFAMHRYWRYWQPQLFDEPSGDQVRLRDAIPEAHVRVDRAVRRLLETSSPDTVVAVVSEHGMAPEPRSSELGPVYWSIRGGRLLDAVGLASSFEPCPIARWVAYRPHTRAANGCAELARRLRGAQLVPTGRRLLQVQEHGGDVIVKLDLADQAAADAGTDLGRLPVRIDDRTMPFSAIARPLGSRRSAMHARDGILLVHGNGIRAKAGLEGATLVDVLPTLLAATGRPVPDGLDGSILDVFD
jgi:hypothetical protein